MIDKKKLLELIAKKVNAELSEWQREGDYSKGWKDFGQSLLLDVEHGEKDETVEDPSTPKQTVVKKMKCDNCKQEVPTYQFQTNNAYELRCVHCNKILAEEGI